MVYLSIVAFAIRPLRMDPQRGRRTLRPFSLSCGIRRGGSVAVGSRRGGFSRSRVGDVGCPVMVKFTWTPRITCDPGVRRESRWRRFPLYRCWRALVHSGMVIRIGGSPFARTSAISCKSWRAREELPGAAGSPFVTAASASSLRRRGFSSTTCELKRLPKGQKAIASRLAGKAYVFSHGPVVT